GYRDWSSDVCSSDLLFMHELAQEARGTYGAGADQVHDGAHLRFINELNHRLTRIVEQLLADEATRPPDDVVLRMLLAPRADKVADRKSTRLNSSHGSISYAVFCLKK